MSPAQASKHQNCNFTQNLEVLIKSNGMLVGVGQPAHDPTLLVVTHTLLKEVGLAPAPTVRVMSAKHVRTQCATPCHGWAIKATMSVQMGETLTVVRAAPSTQRGTWSCRSSHSPTHATACQLQTLCTVPSAPRSCQSALPAIAIPAR